MLEKFPTVLRGGFYYRVVAPNWADPADTSYSKQFGGRWNPPGEFGALYLNVTLAVAAANARARHAGRAVKLFDLLPEARPELVSFQIAATEVVDACRERGIEQLGFDPSFPFGVLWAPCQAIARQAHEQGLSGVAARSNAEVTAHSFVGEELALFDAVEVGHPIERLAFQNWYPDPIPGE